MQTLHSQLVLILFFCLAGLSLADFCPCSGCCPLSKRTTSMTFRVSLIDSYFFDLESCNDYLYIYDDPNNLVYQYAANDEHSGERIHPNEHNYLY
jgi:hypothetical protein